MLEPWRWRTYAELSGRGATCVVQTPDKVVWFGTNEAAWRYDGFGWKKAEIQPIRSGGGMNALTVEPDGALLAVAASGIQRHRQGRWEWVVQRTDRQFGDFRKAVAARDGTIWVATAGGLLEISGKKTRLHTSRAQAARLPADALHGPVEPVVVPDAVSARVSVARRQGELAIADLTLDEAGGLWLVADEGEVLHFTGAEGGGAWQVYSAADGLKPGRRPSILRRREGDVWVIYGEGSGNLNVFDGQRWTARPLAAEGVSGDGGNLLQTRDGTVWLSARYVVAAWRGGRWQRYEKPQVPIPNVANFIAEGSGGELWIGGAGTEICRVDYGSDKWRTFRDLMFQWEAPDGTEWFLHRNGRVVRNQRGQWRSFGPEDGLPGAPVALIGTRAGEIWVAGSHDGEAAMARSRDAQRWERIVPPEFAWGVDWRGVYEAADGALWFAATVDSRAPSRHRAGLLQYRDGRWIHHHQPGRAPTGADDNDPATLLPATQRPEPVAKLSGIGESPAGRIWAARNLVVAHDGRRWERVSPPTGLKFGQIDTVFTTHDQELWIGSRQFGAFRFDGREWRSFQEKGGLVANSIRSFAQTDDHTLWVSTDRDVTRYDGRTWTSAFFPSVFVAPHDGGSLRAGRGKKIWVNRFPPAWMIRAWAGAPTVRERPVDDEFWTVGHAYEGEAPETVFTLAPARISPPGNLSVSWRGKSPWREDEVARLQFAHRLDGGPWSDFSADTSGAFFELPPGRHRLEVRARDQDFNVDPTPAVLEFEVLPPVWRQGWFVALMVLVGGALSVLTFRLAKQQLRLHRTNRELAAEIAQHRLAERAKAESEARFQELATAIDEVFWMIEVESGAVLYVSPAFERIWGWSCAALYADARVWTDAILPEERARVLAERASRQASGDYQGEYRIRRLDGEVRWISDRSFPVRGVDGKRERIVGVARDITQRVQVQEELRTRDEYFQSLIEHSSDLISVLSTEGRIRYLSPAANRVLRRPAGAPLAESIFEWIHPDDCEAVRQAIGQEARSEQPLPVDFRVRTYDGGWRVLQSVGRRLSGNGLETLVVVNSRDVTEMRELESQFRQVQKMEALGLLAGGVAHDFNNLLTVISGNADLLRANRNLAPEEAALVADIHGAAARAAALTRQLLVFSRQEKPQKREVELGQLVGNLGKMLRRLITEEVVIEIAGPEQPLWLRADPGMIEQVVLNLAINARDAMPSGGRLMIRLRATAAADSSPSQALLEVEDTGTGIADEVLPRIFEPFFSTKEVGKGTGLGLATVFGIVQQHQGRVEVQSELGRGTIFRVYLPRIEAAAVVEEKSPPPADGGRGECILLVEDEPAVREVGLRALRRRGYRVLTAENGHAALELWARHREEIALLMTDVIMPGGTTGIQLARQLRAEQPNLRVIFCSGYSREPDPSEQTIPGAAYLAKPYSMEALFQTVRETLDQPHDAG